MGSHKMAKVYQVYGNHDGVLAIYGSKKKGQWTRLSNTFNKMGMTILI